MRLKSLKTLALAGLLILALVVPAQATIQWANNATSVIADAGGISAGSLSLTVIAGHGDRFPAVSAPHYFMVTLVDTAGNREIVKVTNRAALSNTMTIERAQESTSARAFAAGSLVELRVTKNALDYLSKSADIQSNYYVADASAADQGATTNTSSIKSLVDTIGASKQATIVLPHTGTGNTTTYTVSTGFTITSNISLIIPKGSLISVDSGQTLTMNGIVQAGAYQVFTGTGTAIVSTYPQDQAWWAAAERLDVTSLTVGGSAAGYPVPAGVILPYAGATAPTGWLLCYGQEVSRTTYAALFALIGTTYGAGDGSTTFNLPDFRGRMAVGLDNMGGAAANRVAAATFLGQASGAENVNLQHAHAIDHTHSVTTSNHAHGLDVVGPFGQPAGTQAFYLNAAGLYYATASGGGETVTSGASSAANSGNGGSTTQAIMNPYIGINYIIKY